ncbi:DUF2971 domain-containing protein [Algoriphagus halophytocola]|uniref:DUF2971 domain-containing protein n=1 Tax=Algoriphagus halophytocola TaxID=2991499 RepID=A0ABY6MBY3_9BACT|nr:DUF2971 domain-containing protein [Algoriphagus sp. TR-M5]UZD21158.1 DUF2971 domain-containing protein [Algoriphagus sp. TR-M5]
MIYQYTSIGKLKLILDSKKIRFTRLDRVDDKDESEPFKNKGIADKVFVSCWTEDSDENSGLWSMYGDDFKGVRIGFKRPIFKLHEIPSSKWNGLNIFNEHNRKVVISPNEMITSDYFIIPSFLNESTFFKKIEYVPTNELEEKYAKYTDFEVVNGVANLTLNFQEVAKYKKSGWKHQLESRYILGIIPFAQKLNFVPDFNNKQHTNIIIDSLATSLVNEIAPNITHYDININDFSLNNIEILIGPKCNERQIETVKNLLERCCSNYHFTMSELSFRI